MADLLAIVSGDRSEPVSDGALSEFVATYESLRGAAPRRQTAASGWVHACTLERTCADTAGVLRDGAGWTAWAGSLPPSPASMSDSLEQIDGQFALVRLSADGEELQVATDGLGMKPLFLAATHGRTYVATSALVLAKHLGFGPSRPGLEAFLRGGLQFGRETLWAGIERMRPAERRIFSDTRQRTETYWQPAVDPALAELSLGEAAELCIERATEAIGSRYHGRRPWVDLTGGFDSRLLALLARRAGVEFATNTVGEEDSEDVRLGNRVARSAGWPWTQLQLPGDWSERLPALAEEALAWGDGGLDALTLATVLQGHREKAETGGTTLLNGGGGEEFRDHPWGHELLAAGRSTTVNYDRLIRWRILLPVDLSVMRTDPTVAVTRALKAELEHRAAPFSSLSNVTQGDVLYAYKMTGHSGAFQAAAGAAVDMEVPFYLRPILLSVISVATRHRRFHRLMREMIARLDPALARIPTDTGGPAGRFELRTLPRFAPYASRRTWRFATRVRGRLAAPASTSAPPSREQLAAGALIARLQGEGRLDPATMRSRPLYDEEALGHLLRRAATHPAGADWTTVGRVVTAELALEAVGTGLG